MDVFDQYHICNHSDEEGRYAYKVCCSSVSRHDLHALIILLATVTTFNDVRLFITSEKDDIEIFILEYMPSVPSCNHWLPLSERNSS